MLNVDFIRLSVYNRMKSDCIDNISIKEAAEKGEITERSGWQDSDVVKEHCKSKHKSPFFDILISGR